MKQVLSQHIREQKEGSSRKKAGFFSSLFFALAMSCSSLDGSCSYYRPCYCGFYSWTSSYKPPLNTDFINSSDIRDLLQGYREPNSTARKESLFGWEDFYFNSLNSTNLYPSPEKEEEEENKRIQIYSNWLTGETVIKEEEIILDKFAPLKVA